jgi:hypothetical protein
MTAEPNNNPAELLPYRHITEDHYAERAAETFVIEETPGGPVLRGPCPRCSDPMFFPLFSDVFRGTLPDGTQPSASTTADDFEPILCTCRGEHPNRPAEYDGCGAYWNFEIPQATP